jgi:NADH dehydrogenase
MINDVLVLGGSGFIGTRLCEMLVERSGGAVGSITVVTRHANHARHLLVLPDLDVVEADIHDDTTLAHLLAGRQAVVNLVGTLHGDAQGLEKVHAKLPFRLSRLCQLEGVPRIVHVSALGAAPDAPSMYLRSKAAGEAALRDGPVAATILRPSLVFGAHDHLLNLFARLARKAPFIPLAAADAQFQPVWVDDLCRALYGALDAPLPLQQTYEIAGPQVCTLESLVRLAARCSGHERRIVRLSPGVARAQAMLFELLSERPLLSRDNLASMQVPSVASGTLPGLKAFGITKPTSIEAVAPHVLGGPHAARQVELDELRRRRRRYA